MSSYRDEVKKIAEHSSVKCLFNEPLSRHTSFKIGGAADLFALPESADDIYRLVELCKAMSVPFYLLGNGSNVLFSDDGFRGAVICTSPGMNKIRLIDDNTIECECGVKLSELCSFALANSLTGFECLWGIPGSVGGAVVTNAGAYGAEISDVAVRVNHICPNNTHGSFSGSEIDFSYRHSVYEDNDNIILSVIFKSEKGDKALITEKMDDLLARRKAKQPLEFPSAGSIFKRPVGAYAAALIEQSGLKGVSVGGARVSEKHSGFIINDGNASSGDVRTLIEIIKKTVKSKTGYELECEIRMVN